jgi:2,4-dienoyl-CoA reductase-like NADH-dependent reductase (Old Yellow Enzyme family)
MAVMTDPFAPVKLGPITLRNRVIKAATFEGLAHDSRVTQELIDFHRDYAAGGVGMTTVAYCAVAPDGRTEANQIQWTAEAMPGLRTLTDAMHAEGAAVSAQIGHAGPVADPRGNKMPAIGPSRAFPNLAGRVTRKASQADIDRVIAAHANAAKRAIEAGFDAVEVHLGHSYFASAFLSPKVNKRRDEYGGSLENRAKVARSIGRVVREAVGDRIAIIAKLNMTDGVRGGITMEESIQTAKWLEEDGSVDAMEMTAGSSLLNPMYLFRGDVPVGEFVEAMEQPMKSVMKVGGKAFLKSYPYENNYLLNKAAQVRAEIKTPLIALGGIVDRPSIDRALDAGFDFVAMGRSLLREPDLVNRIAADPSTPSLCIHCNRCMPTNFTGTYCPEIIDHSPRTAGWASGATTL